MNDFITVNGDAVDAVLMDYSCGQPAITPYYNSASGAVLPKQHGIKYGFRPLSVVLEVTGSDRDDVMLKISALTALFSAQSEISLPDGLTYTSVLTSVSDPEFYTEDDAKITYTFAAARHGPEQTLTGTGSSSVQIAGTAPTDAVISFTAPASGTASVCGITFTDLTPGATVVIDGRSKTVTQNGANAFLLTDLTAFPVLYPGANALEITAGLAVTLKYYPMYL